MNLHTFTSSELDLIYDVIFERLGCTERDEDVRDCNSIIDKMHVHCVMYSDAV